MRNFQQQAMDEKLKKKSKIGQKKLIFELVSKRMELKLKIKSIPIFSEPKYLLHKGVLRFLWLEIEQKLKKLNKYKLIS
jgi:hypothetical protein